MLNTVWVGIGINLLTLFGVGIGFIKVIKNDLCHVEKDQQVLKAEVKEIKDCQLKAGERLANIEGKLDILVDRATNKNTTRLDKTCY